MLSFYLNDYFAVVLNFVGFLFVLTMQCIFFFVQGLFISSYSRTGCAMRTRAYHKDHCDAVELNRGQKFIKPESQIDVMKAFGPASACQCHFKGEFSH